MRRQTSSTVWCETRQHTLVIRIDREPKRNAIDEETAAGLDAALRVLDGDDDLWVGVLTGGPNMFSAGTDLSLAASPTTPDGGEYGLVRRRRRRPLIAAVEGVALGGGFEIVLSCDLVIAGQSARFGLPEALRGVVAGSGGLHRAPAALPRAVATELLLTGRTLGADEASRLGLVNRVSPNGAALDHALLLAEEVCRASPNATEQTLRALQAQRAEEERRGWEATSDAINGVQDSADLREGVDAFFTKREPRWTGR